MLLIKNMQKKRECQKTLEINRPGKQMKEIKLLNKWIMKLKELLESIINLQEI